MLAPGAMGIKWLKKRSFINMAKGLGLYRQVTFHSTHAHETAHIHERISRNAEIECIPNIPKPATGQPSVKRKSSGELRILSVARIAPEKNIHFALKCLTNIDRELNVEAHFAGPVYDSEYFERCRKIASSLPENVTVHWHFAVPPTDIAALLAETHLFFSPSLGENYGHAIVEALFSSVPVLISDQTPWRNLEELSLGADLSLSNMADFTNFIEAMARLDADAYVQLSGELSHRASKLINFPGIIDRYKMLFK